MVRSASDESSVEGPADARSPIIESTTVATVASIARRRYSARSGVWTGGHSGLAGASVSGIVDMDGILQETGTQDQHEGTADHGPVAAAGHPAGHQGVFVELAGQRLGQHGRLVGAEFPVGTAADGQDPEGQLQERGHLVDLQRGAAAR
jgi:hypothetical protein